MILSNIKALLQIGQENILVKKGNSMREIPVVENAWLWIENGLVKDYGSMDTMPLVNVQYLDASGRMVLPGFCDSHTHIVFAQWREEEFVDKIKGISYEEIAKKGGGILNSARKLHLTSEEELYDCAQERLEEMVKFGTTAVEIKSGYGLSTQDELKMLRVIKRLKLNSDLAIKATFLGAHAMPLAYKENRKGYIDLIVNEMIPQIALEGLADYCDVFCDRGFFTVEETDTILEAGNKIGLKPKIHANELDFSGGIQVGVKHKALSVDHLEFTGEAEIEALLKSDTMPTLLPSTAFFLGLHYPPARKMIDAGLPIALASDYNPGSSPSGNVQFTMALACIKMKMLPFEAINACTINSAYAMDLSSSHGRIAKGWPANLIITQKINSVDFIPYGFTKNHVYKTMVNGKLV
jgi:imidazolonepropionase